MARVCLTEDEIAAQLRHSSLTTILVEGKTDMSIYRWIEDDLSGEIDIQSCGGRETLFNLYDRRDEFKNIKVVFLADSDRYVYTSIPDNYRSIIFTKGYSIENDLYQGKKIEDLLSKEEKKNFDIALENFILYYACQLDKMDKQPGVKLDQHPKWVLDVANGYVLKPETVDGGYCEASDETKNKLRANYDLLLRGHSLISLIQIFLSGEKRDVKFSNMQICACCYKLKRSEAIEELLLKLNGELSA